MDCVLDASVAVKWFLVQEGDSHKAIDVLKKCSHFYVPDFFFIETGNILLKYYRKGVFTANEISEMRLDLTHMGRYEIAPWIEIEPKAFSIAMEMNHALYDCLYLALASQENLPFVTADVRLINKMRNDGLSFPCDVIPLGEFE